MKKTGKDKTIHRRLAKGFADEGQFERFLLENKGYVLDLMAGDRMWDRQKYICDSTLLVCSVRYAVGRKTGIVRYVVDWIVDEWERVEGDVRADIVREILDYEKHYGNIGSSWDREQWYRIVNKDILGYLNETV
jgi:hypothetical protein